MDYSKVLLQPGKTYYEYDHNNQRYLKYTTLKVYHPYPCEEDPPEGLGAPLSEGLQTEGESMLLDCGGYYSIDTIEEDKYVDKYFEKDIANNTKNHIYLGDIKLATVNNTSTPYYIISDHLSSNNLITDNTGNILETSDYEPFGKVNYSNIVQNTDNQYKFTGKEYDDENNLQYFGARYLDNGTARFYAVDPILVKIDSLYKVLEDPQALNSYAYSRNNPVILVDKDGNFYQIFTAALGAVAGAVWAAPDIANMVKYTVQGNLEKASESSTRFAAKTATGLSLGFTAGLATRPLLEIFTPTALIAIEGAAIAAPHVDKVDDLISEGTKLLNPPINITERGLSHVIKNHTGFFDSTRSIFNSGEDLVELIKSTTQSPMTQQALTNNFERITRLGRNIGVDRFTGQQTNIITTITNSLNELITSFPGLPAYLNKILNK